MKAIAMFFVALLSLAAPALSQWTLSTFGGDGRMEYVQRGSGLVAGVQDMAAKFTLTFRLKGRAWVARALEWTRLPSAVRFDVLREASIMFSLQFACFGDSTFQLGGNTYLHPYWATPIGFLGPPSYRWETFECQFFDSTDVKVEVDSLVIFFEFPFNGQYEIFIDNVTFVYGDSAVLIDSMGDLTAVDSGIALPEQYILLQNYPNPFNPETTIKYQLAGKSEVSLKVYNLLGQEVRRLVDRSQVAAYHVVVWDGRDNAGNTLPSGIYFYRLESGNFQAMKKMILMK